MMSALQDQFGIVATGAVQPKSKLERDVVADVSVVGRWGGKLLQSGDVLIRRGLHEVAKVLQGRHAPTLALPTPSAGAPPLAAGIA